MAPEVGMHLAGQHVEEGALAGAVRTDDAAKLASLDSEIDVAVRHQAAVSLRKAPSFQDRPAHSRRRPALS